MADSVKEPKFENGSSGINSNYRDKKNNKGDAQLRAKIIDNEGKKEERGWLGRLWGSIEHSSNNIAGLFIMLLLIIASGYTFSMLCCKPDGYHEKILDFWGIITPLLTLALGYIFGKGPSN